MAESGSKDVFLTMVVPAFGALISLLMYASPVQTVLHAAKLKALGDLNPIPFCVTVANTIAWCTYGLIKQDPYVTAPNATGIVVAFFTLMTCYGLAEDKLRGSMRFLLCLEIGILAFLGVLTSFAARTLQEQQAIWGMAGNIICLIYYAAPLGTMAEVLRTRNSASILLPMTIMNTVNAALWTTYGLAMLDVYIWLPNGIGLVLSVMQLILAFVFPSRPKQTTSAAGPLHEASYTRLTHGASHDEEHSEIGIK